MDAESLSVLTPITSNEGSFYRLRWGGQLVLFSSNGEFMLTVKHDASGRLVTKTTYLGDSKDD